MISITVTNLDGVVNTYRSAPEMINRAVNASVTTVTRKAEREIEGDLSKATDIPRKVFSVWRVKRFKRVPRGTGKIWAGYNPIKAAYVGTLKQEDWGASARSYLFPGGFIAKMKSGHVGIYKRDGSNRKSLVEQRVNVPQAPQIAASVEAKVGPWFQDEFAKQVTRRVLK